MKKLITAFLVFFGLLTYGFAQSPPPVTWSQSVLQSPNGPSPVNDVDRFAIVHAGKTNQTTAISLAPIINGIQCKLGQSCSVPALVPAMLPDASNATLPTARTNLGAMPFVSLTDYGAIMDGTSHPLSTRYATLAQAQAVCPQATSLTQEIDWCAVQAAVNFGATLPGVPSELGTGVSSGIRVILRSGAKLYTGSSTVVANNVGLSIEGEDQLGSVILVATAAPTPWISFGLSNGMAPQTATVSARGQAFNVGDTLTFTGGTCATAPVITVTSIFDGGGINGTSITNAGTCASPPSNPMTYSTTGGGVNASINGTFSGTALQSIAFVGTGTGCNNGDTLTIQGGSVPGGSPVSTVLTVTNASGGVIQSGGLSITTPGSYGTPPPNMFVSLGN